MAKRSQFKMSISERRRRNFSENFKKGKVKELESGVTQVNDLCKQYEVSSTSVYRWLKLYGSTRETQEKMIVESLSDTQELLRLKKQVADLERIVGQKQIMIDFKDKMIELAEETYGVDIKKKFSTKPSVSSGK
jgi:transposase-like protein